MTRLNNLPLLKLRCVLEQETVAVLRQTRNSVVCVRRMECGQTKTRATGRYVTRSAESYQSQLGRFYWSLAAA